MQHDYKVETPANTGGDVDVISQTIQPHISNRSLKITNNYQINLEEKRSLKKLKSQSLSFTGINKCVYACLSRNNIGKIDLGYGHH